VFQKPVGGKNRSARRDASKLGKLFLLKSSALLDEERATDGSSFTLQINAPFSPSAHKNE
jgi:hypothetical protein